MGEICSLAGTKDNLVFYLRFKSPIKKGAASAVPSYVIIGDLCNHRILLLWLHFVMAF